MAFFVPPDLIKSLLLRETSRKILWKHPCCSVLPLGEQPSHNGGREVGGKKKRGREEVRKKVKGERKKKKK